LNRTLLWFVLRRHRFALIACWLVPVLIAVAVGILYPTYAKEREAIGRITKIFGRLLGNDAIDILSPLGFLSLPFQHPLTLLMLAISSAVAALALPAGDRGRGSLDLLLATRLTRRATARTILGAILLAGATFGWAPYLGVWVASNLAGYAHEIPFDTCVLVALNAGALVVALGTSALFCSATADDGGSATTRFVGFVVVTLAIDVVARVWKAGKWLRWTNLLGYYHPPELLGGQTSPWLTIGVLLAFSAVVYVATEAILERRRRA
jgi:hypothetical protein